MRSSLSRAMAMVLCLLGPGCSDQTEISTTSRPDMGSVTCMPTEDGWAAVQPTVETYCGQCHGETPAFGAPYGLLDYDALLVGEESQRPVDRLVARMRMGDMPPVGQPTVPSADVIALLDWATCGENDGDPGPGPNPGGFDVSRPLFTPPDVLPEESTIVEFRADNGHIPADVDDQYTCFSFAGPPGGERFIRRFEPIIDDTRVLHHIVLYEVDEGPGDGSEVGCGTNLSAAVYAWAPGQQPMQFVEGGLTTDASRRYLLEIHYNNSAGYDDVADVSGVRIFHTEPEGPVIDMLTIGPDGFQLPARARTAVEGSCNIDEPMRIIATLPHMHELGVNLTSTIKRADGSIEDLITLQGWDFDSQFFYDAQGLELRPGDEVVTECVFENMGATPRRFGPFTDDEMCFNFLFVTPAPSERRCNENREIYAYEPGACAPQHASDEAEPTWANPLEGAPPPATGGVFPRGHWRLVDYTLIFESADIGIAVVDLEQSVIVAGGAFSLTTDGRIEFDIGGKIDSVLTSGNTSIQPIGISFAGTILEDNPDQGQIRIDTDCPDERELAAEYSYEDERLTFYFPFMRTATGVAVSTFEFID